MSDLTSRIRSVASNLAEMANDGIADIGLLMYNIGTRDMSAAAAAAQAIGKKAEPKSGEDYPPDSTTRRGMDPGDWRMKGSAYDWYEENVRSSKVRKAVYRETRQMYDESPELAAAANVIARNVCSSEDGDEITFTTGAEDKQVKRIMDDMDTRTGLPRRAQAMCLEHVVRGDAFVEIVTGQETKPLIWGLHELTPTSMKRVEEGGVPVGFEQADSAGNDVVQWDSWEILHLRYNRPFTSLYGQSLYWPIRKTWKQVAALDDAAVVMVLERAAQVRVHKVPVSADRTQQGQDINDYKIRNRRKKSYNSNNSSLTSTYNPMDSAEVWTPVPIGAENYPTDLGVSTLDGQHNYDKVITVVEYFQRKCLVPLGVPPSYLGIEKETKARAVNTQQEIEFGRFLRQIQGTLAYEFKRNLYELQLRFAYGKDIPREDYWVEFPRPSKADEKVKAEITKIQAEAAALIGQSFNVPLDAILVAFFNWGERDAKELADRIGVPTEETEGLGRQAKKNLLDSIRREASGNSERARELGDLLDVMADAAEFLAEPAVRV